MEKEIDWTKPIQQKNGTKLHLVTTNSGNKIFPVLCLELEEEGGGISHRTCLFKLNGRFFRDEEESIEDAINVPDEVKQDPDASMQVIKDKMYAAVDSLDSKIMECRFPSRDSIIIMSEQYTHILNELRKSIDNL